MDTVDAQLTHGILASLPVAAVLLDPQGCVEYLNPLAEVLTGHALDGLRGRDWVDALLPADERDGVRDRLRAVMAGLATHAGVDRIVARDGRRLALAWTARRVDGADGRPARLLATVNDVGESVAAEQAWRDRDPAYRLMFESNPWPMWVYDLESLRFLAVNDAAVDAYGYSRDEFLLRTIADIRPPQDWPALADSVARSTDGLEHAGVWRHRRRDGSVFEVSITSHSIPFDGHDARLVVARDVSEQRQLERRLQDSHARLLEAQRVAQIGSWELDLLRGRLHWSDEVFRIFGLDPAAATPSYASFLAAVHPEDRDAVDRAYTASVAHHRPCRIRHRLTLSDGRVKWVEERWEPQVDAQRRPLRLLGTVQDVSAEMQARDEAVAARDLLRDVLARVDDGFVAIDRHWRFTYLNERGARLLGSERPEDLVGRPIWAVAADTVGQPFRQAYERALQTQQPQQLVEYHAAWARWFENRIYPSPDGLSIYFSDITARKEAELQVQRSEERLRHFFDSGLVGMAITVPSKHWGEFNQRLCDMLGYSAEQMRGLTWVELTHPDDLDEDLAHYARVLSGDSDGYRMDKRFIRADGSVLHAAIAVRCERDAAGVPLRFFAIVEDIGARKQAEQALARHREDLEREVRERTAQLVAARDEAERANHAKSEFLSRMSHELRTPMNAILGFAQLMLLETGLDARHRPWVEESLRAGRHLLALINEVLDLARIESGRLDLAPEPLSLAELVAESVHMTAPMAEARAIGIDVRGLDGVVLRADRTRLRQVLLNLLSNAVKYNRTGGRVHIECQMPHPARVRLTVTDTGPGIAPQRLHELFRPFQRLGAEFGEVEGTGIGLSIARHLVEMMGGQIGVDGRPGQGACFWVELPSAALAPPPAAPGSDGQAPAAPSPRPQRRTVVLYVEDNQANLTLMEQIAARHPAIEFVAARAARPGLELALSRRPDLVLLDIGLPDSDGMAVLARLRSDEATRSIPVVAVTAHAMPDDERRARAAGFDDYIAKPVDVARIDALLARVVAGGADVR